MGVFPSKNHFPVDGRTILITGGSQGMGRSVARLLARKGANVVVAARNVGRLEEAIEHIAAGATQKSQRFHFISVDLTSSAEATRVLSETTAWNNNSPPDIVWCCAGSSSPALFIDAPVTTHQSHFETNYLSALYIAHAALQIWLKPSQKSSDTSTTFHTSPTTSTAQLPLPRHLIFTSSVLALYPIAGYSPYSPTKASLRILTDTLSQELLLYPPTPSRPAVIPHCIFPATIFSQGYIEENKSKHPVTLKLEEDDKGLTPEEVAEASVKGLERGEEMVTTDFLGGLMWRSVMGFSRKRLWDTLVGMMVLWVVGWVRWDMDRTVQKWGRGEVSEMKPKEMR
ncbi:MAG: hypothetical protein L6R42_003015 [Xanthoria sp. 1 TBL-2021]|nr:MAG: hypothetical protein L6R42_003015 [Xanthoria sp. 1 TBL-2021]